MTDLSSSNKNATLLAEILGNIFIYIRFGDSVKKEIRIVCKSWNNAAIYQYGENIRFSYKEKHAYIFSKDLQASPTLRAKVIFLTINPHSYHQQNGSSKLFMRYILPSCPSLVELNINTNKNNPTYVEKLNKLNESGLPKLRILEVNLARRLSYTQCYISRIWKLARLIDMSEYKLVKNLFTVHGIFQYGCWSSRLHELI